MSGEAFVEKNRREIWGHRARGSGHTPLSENGGEIVAP